MGDWRQVLAAAMQCLEHERGELEFDSASNGEFCPSPSQRISLRSSVRLSFYAGKYGVHAR